MDAGPDVGSGYEGNQDPERNFEQMRLMLLQHRKRIAQKAEIREQPGTLSVRLAEMAEELNPYDSNTEAIRLLIEAEQVREIEYQELDKHLDQLVDSFMTTMIALFERLRPPGR